MAMAILGMVIYSWAVEKAKMANAPPPVLLKESNLNEEDVALMVVNNDVEKNGIELGQGTLK